MFSIVNIKGLPQWHVSYFYRYHNNCTDNLLYFER